MKYPHVLLYYEKIIFTKNYEISKLLYLQINYEGQSKISESYFISDKRLLVLVVFV